MANTYARLTPDWLMRSWTNSPLALVNRAIGNLCEFRDPDAIYAVKALDGTCNIASLAYAPKHRAIIDLIVREGIARYTDEPDPIDDLQRLRCAPNPCLLEVHWAITGLCNFKCRHCFMESPRARYGDMTWEQIENVVDQLVRANVVNVSLTGGEPMLHPRFKDVVRLLTDRGIYINNIVTNASFLDDDMLGFLKDMDQLHELQVSFDGTGTHDAMRGTKDMEQRVLQAISAAIATGCKVSVDTIFERSNKDAALATYDTMRELNPAVWLVSRSQSMGMWKADGNPDALTTDEMGQLCLDILYRWLADGKPFPIMLEHFYVADSIASPCHRARVEGFTPDTPECPTTKIKIFLMPDGTLMPCTGFTGTPVQKTMPNIFNEGLSPAWSDSALRRFVDTTKRHRMESIEQCSGCEYLESCGAGCRSYALTETGSMDSPDPFACARYRQGWYERFALAEKEAEDEARAKQAL